MSRINTNISSLQARNRLDRNQASLATSLQRMSSGLRINSGKDAPAALIASETLRSEIGGIRQAIDNSQRANNVISTAEGALSEVSALLLEVQSLTNEAANEGALSPQEIQANQLQVDAILNSINRISNTTQFNGVKLLNGSLDYTTSGVAASAISTAKIFSAKLPDKAAMNVTVTVTASAELGQMLFNGATVGTSAVTVSIAGNAGTEQLTFAAGTTTSSVALAVTALRDATGVSAYVSGSDLVFNSTAFGSDQFVSVKTLKGSFLNGQDSGVDAEVNINGSKADVRGTVATLRTGNMDIELTLSNSFAQTLNTDQTFAITGGGAKFQLGSEVNRQGQYHIGVTSVTTTQLGDEVTGYLSELASGGDSSLVSGNTVAAQKILTKAIKQVADLRGRLGAFQKNVLDSNVNSLSIALENVVASESKIRDTDFAQETSEMTRAQILVQANTAVLATANQLPTSVLSLVQ
ncbi:MAG: flagellin [Phycisphaerales bacterium]|nr:flagellin [Phycisphaerales bacterium]